MTSKQEHVKRAGQTRPHACHWPGCDAQCPPAMWGCKAHWFTLPKVIRDRIWRAYSAGQEERMDPSREYIEAARAAEKWCVEYIEAKAKKESRQLDLYNARADEASRR